MGRARRLPFAGYVRAVSVVGSREAAATAVAEAEPPRACGSGGPPEAAPRGGARMRTHEHQLRGPDPGEFGGRARTA